MADLVFYAASILALAALIFFGTLIFFTAVLDMQAALTLAALCAATGAAGLAVELAVLSL